MENRVKSKKMHKDHVEMAERHVNNMKAYCEGELGVEYKAPKDEF